MLESLLIGAKLKTFFILKFEGKKGDQLKVQGKVCRVAG
jgi:hypothetical protein